MDPNERWTHDKKKKEKKIQSQKEKQRKEKKATGRVIREREREKKISLLAKIYGNRTVDFRRSKRQS